MYNKLTAISILIFLISCVKDPLPECPYQYSVQLVVSEMNYFNTDEFPEEKIQENLAFNTYIQNIYYTLKDIKTGADAIKPQHIIVSGDEKTENLILDLIPDGKYILVVWGNVDSSNKLNMQPEHLHDNNTESRDVYLAYDTLNIITGVAQNTTLGLKRTTGKLKIKLNGLPPTISKIEESITSIVEDVDWDFDYSNTTNVNKSFLKSSESLDELSTCLAPTVQGLKSNLTITMRDGNDKMMMEVPMVEVIIKRNQITGMEVNYNALDNTLEIWANVNNEWILVNKLELNLQK